MIKCLEIIIGKEERRNPIFLQRKKSIGIE